MSKNTTIWKQDFFKDVEPIRLMEPLAHILGAQEQGEPFVINYPDAGLVAGHSCPAVSGSYRLTQKALKALYGEEMPVRGQIKVLIKGGPADLAYGPQSHVISLITGVAGPEEKELFFKLWQGNVRKILMESDSYPGLIEVEDLPGFKFPQLQASDSAY